jgi:hypothetical protein
LEVIMLTRRIAVSVCTLCLAIPAAAGASPAANAPRANGPYGIAPAGPRSTVKAKGPYGIAPAGPRSTVKAKGPYGIPPAGPRSTVKAKGPFGVPPATGSQNTTAGPVHGSAASPRDGINGWGIAAISGAALLAVVVLGCALLLLPARHRARRLVT